MENKILRDSDKTSREKGEKTNKQCKKVSKKNQRKRHTKEIYQKKKRRRRRQAYYCIRERKRIRENIIIYSYFSNSKITVDEINKTHCNSLADHTVVQQGGMIFKLN